MEIDFLGTCVEKLAGILGLGESSIFIGFLGLYAYKKYIETRELAQSKRTETLTKLVEHLKSTSNDLFLMEMVFEDHFKKQLSWHEISFFRSSKRPSNYLHRFINSKSYLSIADGGRKLEYKNGKAPKFSKIGYASWYFVCGLTGTTMLLYAAKIFEKFGPTIIAPWVIVTFSLLGLSLIGLFESIAASTAITLFEEINGQS